MLIYFLILPLTSFRFDCPGGLYISPSFGWYIIAKYNIRATNIIKGKHNSQKKYSLRNPTLPNIMDIPSRNTLVNTNPNTTTNGQLNRMATFAR